MDYIDAPSATGDFEKVRTFANLTQERIAALSDQYARVAFDLWPVAIHIPVTVATYSPTDVGDVSDATSRLIPDMATAFPSLMNGIDFV